MPTFFEVAFMPNHVLRAERLFELMFKAHYKASYEIQLLVTYLFKDGQAVFFS